MTRSAGRALGRWLRVRRCAVHPFPFLTLHRGEPHILLRTLHEMNSSSNVTANDSTLTPSYSVLPLVQVISIMQRWRGIRPRRTALPAFPRSHRHCLHHQTGTPTQTDSRCFLFTTATFGDLSAGTRSRPHPLLLSCEEKTCPYSR
jgi:hypothetical protein